MWSAQVPIFEDEDEAELITRFVEMRAKFPGYDPVTIARHIFKDMRDPELRAGQAAIAWSKDLDITVRIDKAKRNGGVEATPKLTKEELQAKILAVTENENISARDKKVMLEGYNNYAATEGWIVKAIEKKTEDLRQPRVPQVIQGTYND